MSLNGAGNLGDGPPKRPVMPPNEMVRDGGGLEIALCLVMAAGFMCLLSAIIAKMVGP